MIIFGGQQCKNYFNLVEQNPKPIEDPIDLTDYSYTTDGNGVATISKYTGSETNVVVPKSKSTI